jgi:hypothetical protein
MSFLSLNQNHFLLGGLVGEVMLDNSGPNQPPIIHPFGWVNTTGDKQMPALALMFGVGWHFPPPGGSPLAQLAWMRNRRPLQRSQ